MTAYLIIEASVTDEDKWTRYREAVVPLIQKFNGRHLSRSGAAQVLEGSNPGRIAMFEFQSVEAIHDFWNSPEYAAVKALRRDAATVSAWAIPTDVVSD